MSREEPKTRVSLFVTRAVFVADPIHATYTWQCPHCNQHQTVPCNTDHWLAGAALDWCSQARLIYIVTLPNTRMASLGRKEIKQ